MKKLIFIHIPKTGGQSVAHLLEQVCGAHLVCRPGRPGAKPIADATPAEHERFRAYSGHLFYGVHVLLPGDPESYAYFTVLREPVQRLVSFYHHAHRFPGSSSAATRLVDSGQKLLDWLADPVDRSVLNGQAKHLPCADLERFVAVGVTEYLEASVSLLGERMGFPRWQSVKSQNVTRSRPPLHDIPSSVYRQALANNGADFALYRWAVSRLMELTAR